MSIDANRCVDCDRPLATPHDHAVTPEGEGEHLCWRSWSGDVCLHPCVDWRARALTAERRLRETMQHLRRSINGHDTAFEVAYEIAGVPHR